MNMARITRSNRLPESLPLVLGILESHPEGISLPAMEAAIIATGVWGTGDEAPGRRIYNRVYDLLRLLRSRGLVRGLVAEGGEVLWVLDRKAYEAQRRREIQEVLRPFLDGCLMVSDPAQLAGAINEMAEDGTLASMLEERRAQKRRRT